MSQNFPARPPVDPIGIGHTTGPGPLSPAWPRLTLPAPPAHPLLKLVVPLKLLREECYAALATREAPFVLGRAERRALVAALERLRAVNAALPHNLRSVAVARWPSPVLPEAVLLGARDLLPLLGAAISVAEIAADRREEILA